MTQTISAVEAGDQFQRLIDAVQAGEEFVVTRDGAPVARIVRALPPLGPRQLTEAQEAAFARSMERARNGNWGPIEHISREQLYTEVEEARISSLRDK